MGGAERIYNLHFEKSLFNFDQNFNFIKRTWKTFRGENRKAVQVSPIVFFFESEKQLNRYSRHKQEKIAEFYLIKPVCLSLMFDAELGKKSWFILLVFLNC